MRDPHPCQRRRRGQLAGRRVPLRRSVWAGLSAAQVRIPFRWFSAPIGVIREAAYPQLSAETRGRRADAESWRVPYNMGTRCDQQRDDVCPGRRRVAVTSTGLIMRVPSTGVPEVDGDAGARLAVPAGRVRRQRSRASMPSLPRVASLTVRGGLRSATSSGGLAGAEVPGSTAGRVAWYGATRQVTLRLRFIRRVPAISFRQVSMGSLTP